MKERTWLIGIRGDLTHEDVAERAGIARSTYTNIERGRGLSVSLAKKIGIALDFDWNYFYDEKSFETKQITQLA